MPTVEDLVDQAAAQSGLKPRAPSVEDLVDQHALASGLKPAPATGYVSPSGTRLANPEVAGAFRNLAAAAQAEGIEVRLNSGDRSPAEQQRLWANRGSNPNPVAPPGTSNHEKGLAADLSFFRNGQRLDPRYAIPLARQHGFEWFGPRDPVHFTYQPRPTTLAELHRQEGNLPPVLPPVGPAPPSPAVAAAVDRSMQAPKTLGELHAQEDNLPPVIPTAPFNSRTTGVVPPVSAPPRAPYRPQQPGDLPADPRHATVAPGPAQNALARPLVALPNGQTVSGADVANFALGAVAPTVAHVLNRGPLAGHSQDQTDMELAGAAIQDFSLLRAAGLVAKLAEGRFALTNAGKSWLAAQKVASPAKQALMRVFNPGGVVGAGLAGGLYGAALEAGGNKPLGQKLGGIAQVAGGQIALHLGLGGIGELLRGGRPVPTAEIAQRTGEDPEIVAHQLAQWADQGQVVRTPKGWVASKVAPERPAVPAGPEPLAARPSLPAEAVPAPTPVPPRFTVGQAVQARDFPDIQGLRVTAIHGKQIELAAPNGAKVTALPERLQPVENGVAPVTPPAAAPPPIAPAEPSVPPTAEAPASPVKLWARLNSGKPLPGSEVPGSVESAVQAAFDQRKLFSPEDVRAVVEGHGAGAKAPALAPTEAKPVAPPESAPVAAPAEAAPVEPPHHSQLQPRTPEGQFDGPPVEGKPSEIPKSSGEAGPPRTTALNARTTAEEVAAGKLSRAPEPSRGMGPKEALDYGRRVLADQGENAIAHAEGIARAADEGNRPFTRAESGVIHAANERLVKEHDRLGDELLKFGEKDPQRPALQAQYDAAKARLQNFRDTAQTGLGEAGGSLGIARGGVDLDTGSYTSVAREIKKVTGKDETQLTPAERTTLQDLTGRISKLEQALPELQARAAEQQARTAETSVTKTRTRSARVTELKQQETAIKAEMAKIAAEVSGRLSSGPGAVYDGARWAYAAGKLALNRIRQGSESLDAAIEHAVEHLKGLGVTATRADVVGDIRALTDKTAKPLTEEQKARLNAGRQIAQARREATAPERQAAAASRAEALRSAPEPANTIKKATSGRDATQPAATIRGQQRSAAARLQAEALRSAPEPAATVGRIERGAAVEPGRTVKREGRAQEAAQGQVSELERQLASLDPKDLKGLPKRAKTDPTEALRLLRGRREMLSREVQRRIDLMNRTPAQRAGDAVIRATGAIRGLVLGSDLGVLARQGLFAWSRPGIAGKALAPAVRAALSEHEMGAQLQQIEERQVNGQSALLARKRAGLQLTLDHPSHEEEMVMTRLAKKLPLGVGQLAGGLERFQTTWLNTVRADLFDQALAQGFSPAELKQRAEFINSSTGRSNLKQVPRILQAIMTSPRYETSRWEMLARPFKDAATLYQGGQLNRAAAANLRDMAVTTMGTVALFKAAELAGYSVNWNPTSADFLKMRRGDDVWDTTVGMSPRLRDAIRLYVYATHPTHDQNIGTVLQGAAMRTITPGVRVPGGLVSTKLQQIQGVPKPIDPFSGYNEGERAGWITLLPQVFSSAMEAGKAGGMGPGLAAGAQEFVGTSANHYPKPKGNQPAQLNPFLRAPRPPKAAPKNPFQIRF